MPIQANFPGCGITFRNVEDTPYLWWKKYVAVIDAIEEQSKKRG